MCGNQSDKAVTLNDTRLASNLARRERIQVILPQIDTGNAGKYICHMGAYNITAIKEKGNRDILENICKINITF